MLRDEWFLEFKDHKTRKTEIGVHYIEEFGEENQTSKIFVPILMERYVSAFAACCEIQKCAEEVMGKKYNKEDIEATEVPPGGGKPLTIFSKPQSWTDSKWLEYKRSKIKA